MAEENMVEETTEQDSPTVEQEQPETESTDAAEKPEQTPDDEVTQDEPEQEDKNWRAVRERLNQLEEENRRLKSETPKESAMAEVKVSELTRNWLTTEEDTALTLDEFKTQAKYPELDPDSDSFDPLLDKVVAGEYMQQLSAYVNRNLTGKDVPLPRVTAIANSVMKEWKQRVGKAEEYGAAKKKESVQQKVATTEAEGKPSKSEASQEESDVLRHRTQRGDDNATAERLIRSGL